MRRLMLLDPTFEVGYPIDSELSHMTDDGCPLVPARLPAQDERNNLPSIPPRLAKSRWQTLIDEIDLRGRWRAFCE
jgi:hypothetical protein